MKASKILFLNQLWQACLSLASAADLVITSELIYVVLLVERRGPHCLKIYSLT